MANRRTCWWCRWGVGQPYGIATPLFARRRHLCPEHKRLLERLQRLAAARARDVHVVRTPIHIHIGSAQTMDITDHVTRLRAMRANERLRHG